MGLWKHIDAWFNAPATEEELKLCYQARHHDQNRMKQLRSLNTQLNENYNELWKKFQDYKLQKESRPSVNDADYWNDKWLRNRVTYSAPHLQTVQEYIKYEPIDYIDSIVQEIRQNYVRQEKSPDKVVKHIQSWRDEVFYKQMKFKYKLDKTEKWNHPLETLEALRGDCDDVGILFYFIIRQVFVRMGMWDMVRHRLKCACGNVNRPGKIPVAGGGHFFLLWLGESGHWYTFETTYHMDLSRRKFLELPTKADKMYGTLWFTFNEHFSWVQQDLHNDTFDWRKKK